MRILYRFGDNDFRTTFLEVFRVILKTVENGHYSNDPERLRNKEFICKMINDLAYPMYRVVQCYKYPSWDKSRFASEAEHRASYEEYFRADPDKIYIDKEIDELLATYGDGNSAWFVLDTDQHDPKWRVYSV